MGMHYARHDGEAEDVAVALNEQYQPRFAGDELPSNPVACAVAIADKMDTLAGIFGIGQHPKGDKDPFALRRAALGVIRTVLEGQARVSLREAINSWFARELQRDHDGLDIKESIYSNANLLGVTPLGNEAVSFIKNYPFQIVFADGLLQKFEKSIKELPKDVTEFSDELWEQVEDLAARGKALELNAGNEVWRETYVGPVRETILDFFADRLKVTLKDQGKRHDLVDAVFALGDDDLVRIVARVEALDGFLKTDDGKNLLAGYKRASNILKAEEKKGWKGEGGCEILPDASAPEVQLHDALRMIERPLADALAAEDFTAAMRELAGLRGPVDAFLDGVFVNSDVPAERDNRLKTLAAVRDAMGQVADFSLIGG